MAAFAQVGSIINNYRNSVDPRTMLNEAIAGGSIGANALKSLAEMFSKPFYSQPHFIIEGTTDSNIAAASSPVISLSDQGVQFAADTEREIFVETLAWNGANRYKYRTVQRVLGGTNPTLKGSEIFLTNCLAYYGATTSDGAATTEVAAECIAPAWWDGAAPVAGAIASNTLTVQWLGTNAPVRVLIPGMVSHTDAGAAAADARSFQHGAESLTNGTSAVFISDVATPTAATFSNASAFRCSAYLLPPVHSPVIIDTASTPDEVWIGALGLSSDVVTWKVKVWIGEAELSVLV